MVVIVGVAFVMSQGVLRLTVVLIVMVAVLGMQLRMVVGNVMVRNRLAAMARVGNGGIGVVVGGSGAWRRHWDSILYGYICGSLYSV